MMKLYYGFWNNFLNASWPFRFLLEYVFFLFLLFFIYKSLMKIKVFHWLKKITVIAFVRASTLLLYAAGHNKDWAVQADDKIIEWGQAALKKQSKEKSVCRVILGICIVLIYILATLPDLFSHNVNFYYLENVSGVKNKLLKWEAVISRGYEDYPPLFVKKEKAVGVVEEIEEKPEIIIQLNQKGRFGSNIRKEPSLDSDVVDGVKEGTNILYQDELQNDGERYWLKIYLPQKDVTGWLSGNLVDEEQMQEILSSAQQ